MNLRKIASVFMVMLLLVGLVACGDKANESTGEKEKPAQTEESAKVEEKEAEETPEATGDFDTSAEITLVSREDGSGTRGAFIEITGVEGKVDGEKVDQTSEEAMIQNSTNGVMTAVAGDPNGLGYISLGSLNDTVKALKVNGVAATAEGVKDKTYELARPFNLAWKEDVIGDIGKDLLVFIASPEGQQIINDQGYVGLENGEAYTPANLEGTITVAGSTSVTPLMEALVEAYEGLNPGVSIEIQSTGSSAGMTSAMEGSANIGMASRELKGEEAEALTSEAIAMDGIAVIVNNENPLDDLSLEQIKNIYVGEILTWSDLEK